MFGDYYSADGFDLFYNEDDKFYLNIMGRIGAAELHKPINYEDEYPDDFQLLFGIDYPFKNTEITFSFEIDNDKILLLVNKDDEKYYLEYIEDPSLMLLRKEKPKTPIYIKKSSIQGNKYIVVLFNIKQGDDKYFELNTYGPNWWFDNIDNENDATNILFIKHEDSNY